MFDEAIRQAEANDAARIDAGGNNAFIPPGTGRIKITADRGGEANLEFGNGSCAFAPLSLGTEVDGDPAVSGSQPATATGGSGTLAGFIGSGVVTLSNIELGPGADNVADVSISGDFTINQPHMVLGTPQPYWRNLNDYLHHRLTMTVPLRNLGDPPANGDAYAVNLTKARLSARVPLSGVPAPLGRIDAGKAKTTAVTFPNVQANKTYTLKVWIDGTDALDDPFPTVIDSTAVKAPPPP